MSSRLYLWTGEREVEATQLWHRAREASQSVNKREAEFALTQARKLFLINLQPEGDSYGNRLCPSDSTSKHTELAKVISAGIREATKEQRCDDCELQKSTSGSL